MGGAEQVGRASGAASGQEMRGGSAGIPPVVIAVGQESQSVGWVYRSYTGRQMSMLGSFLPPFRHLPLDHPRVDPVAAPVGALHLHLPEDPPIPRRERRG